MQQLLAKNELHLPKIPRWKDFWGTNSSGIKFQGGKIEKKKLGESGHGKK